MASVETPKKKISIKYLLASLFDEIVMSHRLFSFPMALNSAGHRPTFETVQSVMAITQIAPRALNPSSVDMFCDH
jgi:hypothetical protein